MALTSICGIALLGAAACLTVRSLRPELAKPVTVAVFIVLMTVLVEQIVPMLEEYRRLLDGFVSDLSYLETALKAVGLSYLTALSADACREFEEESIGRAVEAIGNVFILSLAFPYLMDFIRELTEIFV